MKKRMHGYTYVSFVMLVSFVSFLFCASWGGYILKTRKTSSTGCGCHGLPSPSVNVQIVGPDTVFTGSTSDYQIVITGGSLKSGGTDIATMDGTLLAGPGLFEEMNELTHNQPMPPSNGAVTFSFQYMAPVDAGIDTIYANGNSTNGDGDDTGDSWNFAPNKAVVILPTTQAVKDNQVVIRSLSLEQNFPNPFNPSTRVKFSLPKDDFVTLRVMDSRGTLIQTLADRFFSAGSHEITFNAGSLPSGIYFYQLKAGASCLSRKMLLLK